MSRKTLREASLITLLVTIGSLAYTFAVLKKTEGLLPGPGGCPTTCCDPPACCTTDCCNYIECPCPKPHGPQDPGCAK